MLHSHKIVFHLYLQPVSLLLLELLKLILINFHDFQHGTALDVPRLGQVRSITRTRHHRHCRFPFPYHTEGSLVPTSSCLEP